MNPETPAGSPSRPRPRMRARVAAVIGILAVSLTVLACGHHDEPMPDTGPKGAAPPAAATGPASGGATAATGSTSGGATGPASAATTKGANEGAVTIDTHPSAPSAAPAPTTPEGAAAAAPPSGPAPGTLSLRFIVRKKETKEELPAGSFEVRLLPLDAIREGGSGSAGSTGPGAGVTPQAPRPDPGTPIGRAAPTAPPPGEYRGSPEQVLVTQLDGSKRTFLAGVKPGTYALRITAKGRRMLLEVLTVKAEDRLVERTLEPE